VAGCNERPKKTEKDEILAYIGITMAKPMAEIARVMEKKHGVNIIITQGGSEDLYQSLETARKGDLYLPGSAFYREKHLADGLLGDFVLVGYNQAAFMVAKGNPKNVLGTIDQVLRDDLAIVICNPQSGSIGRESKRILSTGGLFEKAFNRAEYLTTDSRNLNKALRNGDADLIINWRATAFFDENRPAMDVIDLPPEQATPKKLLLNLLTFSRNPEVARDMMAYSASPEGQAIFRKYGLLDASGNSEK
jgi:molybdate transport system substrate-binding protein